MVMVLQREINDVMRKGSRSGGSDNELNAI